MADETGPGESGGTGPRDPWAPPEDGVPLKKRDAMANEPTVTSMPGAPPPGAHPPAAGAPGAPPPPPQAPYPAAHPGPTAPGPYPYSAPGPQAGPQIPGGGYGYPGAPYGYGGPGGYGYPGGGMGWPGQPMPAGMSNAAMIFGIVSMVLVVTCWGSFLAIITAPVALGLGVSARAKVARGELGGHGQATAGFVMGIVGTVFAAVVIVLIVLTFTVWSDDLENEDDPYTYNARPAASLSLSLQR